MIFNIRHKDEKVIRGYRIAERVLTHPNFACDVAAVQQLTYTKDAPGTVARNIEIWVAKKPAVEVEPFYYDNSKVIATCKKKYPNTIFVNMNGIKYRYTEDYVENGIHESMHKAGYSHGSNFAPSDWRNKLVGDFADKNLSVPWLISRMGVQFAKEKGWLA